MKADVPALKYSECQNMSCFIDGSSIRSEQASFRGVDSSKVLANADNVLENKETLSLRGQCERCVVNEVSYSHLEHVGTNPLLPPFSWGNLDVNTQKKSGQPSSIFPVSEFMKEAYIKYSPSSQSSPQRVYPADDQSADMCNSSQSCSHLPVISGSDSGYQVSDVVIDDSLCCTAIGCGGELYMFEDDVKGNLPQNLENGSMSSQFSNSSSSWNCYPCSTPDNDLVSVENDSPTIEHKQTLIANIADAARNCLEPNNHLTVLENDSPTDEEKQLPITVTADAERSFSSGVVNELSTSEINNYHDMELWLPPERLPSARKAISPTSQKRLCLAMNSMQLYADIDHYKCKGKLFFGKQVENKALPAGSDGEGAESSIKGEGPGQVIQTKASISPKKILKKPKYNERGSPPKKGSPPKGCLEGPHLSRSLPHLSTGFTSIAGCSESAIAFSQRQMHDIESLAMKLMTELKSVKDIVEEKILYEAYRNTSLRNDADEVKRAIKSATKVEETAKRWLSMLARDCKRFCKIMKLTENGSAAMENIIHKEKKKISFADEAGGMLCHVKLFENGMASVESKSEKQKLQAEEI